MEAPKFKEPPLPLNGTVDRYDHRTGNDDYDQASALFRLMDGAQRSRLLGNIANAMQGVPEEVALRQVSHFHRADPAYDDGVAYRLGVKVSKAT